MAQVQVQAQVDRSSPIYAGTRFAYNIVVADGRMPQEKVEQQIGLAHVHLGVTFDQSYGLGECQSSGCFAVM